MMCKLLRIFALLTMIINLAILTHASSHGPQCSETETDEAEGTFRILNDGESEINLGNSTNYIVILGLSGSGKSTLVQFLAGDNDKLFGKRRGFDMLFDDGNNKIGSNTLMSKTLYPEVKDDLISQEQFVDCPGFHDTRCMSFDIAASYFVKKVLDHAENVKLIFTISHSKVRVGNDRYSFRSLLNHASKLIQNVQKFKDSIGLVVTKVDNYPMMPDETVVEYIAEFIEDGRNVIESDRKLSIRKNDVTQANAHDKQLQIIDIILGKNDNGNKIAIFRRPDLEGPISKSALLQQGKRALRKLIFDDVKYSPSAKSDFQFSLRLESQVFIRDVLLNLIDEKISSYIRELADDLYTTYRTKGKTKKDIADFEKQITVEYAEFDSMNHNNLISKLPTCINYALNFGSDKNNLVLNSVAQSEFFREILEETSSNHLTNWFTPLYKFKSYMFNLLNWYAMFIELFDKLQSYDVQLNRRKYNVENIDNWGTTGADQGIEININNYLSFLIKISAYPFLNNNTNLEQIIKMNLNVDEFVLRDLNLLLNSTIKSKSTCYCDGNLFCTGNYVIFSEISTIGLTCPAVPEIAIFASDVVYIDFDFNITGNDVTIISPKWEVIGDHKITISGSAATFIYSSNAENGKTDGEHGKNGSPGKPGMSSNFLGIGRNFINGEHLLIRSIGGRGGIGQSGGSGIEGKSCDHPIISKSQDVNQFERNLNLNGYEFTKIESKPFKLSVSSDDSKRIEEYDYKIISRLNGTVGSNGGHGGRGGRGGNPGHVKLIEFTESSGIRSEKLVGSEGKGGIGGEPGLGGNVAISNKKFKVIFKLSFNSLIPVREATMQLEEFDQVFGFEGNLRSGIKGKNNEHVLGIEEPKLPTEISVQKMVNHYINIVNGNYSSSPIYFVKKEEFLDFVGQQMN